MVASLHPRSPQIVPGRLHTSAAPAEATRNLDLLPGIALPCLDRCVHDGKFDIKVQAGRKFKGVRRRSWGKWVAEIREPNKRSRIWLGSYETAEMAARAYDAATLCLRGPNGSTFNFPHSLPSLPSPAPISPKDIQHLASLAAASARPLPALTSCSPSPPAPHTLVFKDPPFDDNIYPQDLNASLSSSSLTHNATKFHPNINIDTQMGCKHPVGHSYPTSAGCIETKAPKTTRPHSDIHPRAFCSLSMSSTPVPFLNELDRCVHQYQSLYHQHQLQSLEDFLHWLPDITSSPSISMS